MADLNETPDEWRWQWRNGVVHIGGTALFAGSSEEVGNEIFTSDGTAAGTKVWADLVPGLPSSNPSRITAAPNREFGVFHAAYDDRSAIWYTDGVDVFPSVFSSSVDDNELRILAITDHGAYVSDDGTHRNRTDLWFVSPTGEASFVRTFENREGDDAGIGSSAARNSDGTLVFEACVLDDRYCSLWVTDGTYTNTHQVPGIGNHARVWEFGEQIYVDGSNDATYRFESGTHFEVVDSDFLDPNSTAVINDQGLLANQEGQVVFAKTIDSEPLVVFPDGVGRLYSTDDLLLAIVPGDDGRQLLSVDANGTSSPLADLPCDHGAFAASEGETVVVRCGTTVWTTDGTSDGTRQIFVLEAPEDGSLSHIKASVSDGLVWLFQIDESEQGIFVLKDDQLQSHITGFWKTTLGVHSFGVTPYDNEMLVYTDRSIWLADDAFSSVTPLDLPEVDYLDDVFAFSESIWFAGKDEAIRRRQLWRREIDSASSTNVTSQIPDMPDYYEGRMLTDRMLFTTVGDLDYVPMALWSTDGTIEGTVKIYEDESVRPYFGNVVDDKISIELRSLHGEDEWLITDGTVEGTHSIDKADVPEAALVSYTVKGYEYTYNPNTFKWSVQGDFVDRELDGTWPDIETTQVGDDIFFSYFTRGNLRLYRIPSGFTDLSNSRVPVPALYGDIDLAEPFLTSTDDALIVLIDDGLHGTEPWRVPLNQNLKFRQLTIGCESARELQRRIQSSNPGWNELLTYDLNEDSQIDETDLQIWAQRVGAEGDVNVDGTVDAKDLNIVAQNWGQEVHVDWCDGDLNGDRVVNGQDLNEIGRHWSAAAGGEAARVTQEVSRRAIPTIEMTVGDRSFSDRAVGDRAVGDRAVGDGLVGDGFEQDLDRQVLSRQAAVASLGALAVEEPSVGDRAFRESRRDWAQTRVRRVGDSVDQAGDLEALVDFALRDLSW